jgi:hypothetical protein
MALRQLKNIAPKPPKHLLKGGKQLWLDITYEYQLESHQIELLRLLCETLDRLELCRKQLKTDGLFSVNRFGEIKPHCALRTGGGSGRVNHPLLSATNQGTVQCDPAFLFPKAACQCSLTFP